jgi:hypothetical protein
MFKQNSVGDTSLSLTTHRANLEQSQTAYMLRISRLNDIYDQKSKMLELYAELTALLQTYTTEYSILVANVTYLLNQKLTPGLPPELLPRRCPCFSKVLSQIIASFYVWVSSPAWPRDPMHARMQPATRDRIHAAGWPAGRQVKSKVTTIVLVYCGWP